MPVERTFAMLKPGVLSRRIAGEIISRIERKGFDIVALKLMRIPRAMAETHYAEHREKPFFGELVDYIVSGPVIAMVLEGENAIKMLRMLCGSTRAEEACP
ncbi:MAG: nucleoside-diphosphate kinase, partial [Rectinema sp.]|nr:nucleoside-diphosphate kinase [Rectinema sp.]